MQFIAAVFGKRDSSLLIDNAVPREIEFFGAGIENADDLASGARGTGKFGDLAVGGDFAAGDMAEDIDDALVKWCQVSGVGFGARHGGNIWTWMEWFKGESTGSPCFLAMVEGISISGSS